MSKQRITLQELYQKGYTYPCWDLELLNKNIVPRPYVPISKLKCDHEYALDFYKWREIVDTYLKYLLLYLRTGKEFKLPFFMGFLQLRRYKGGGHDWQYWKKYKVLRKYKNVHTQGYRPVIKWYRHTKHCRLNKRWHWKIDLTPKAWSEYSDWLMKDFTRINNLINI